MTTMRNGQWSQGLPAETTGFMGRTAELDAVAALVAASRPVALTGTAGVGKT
ncbi:hypothetical protein [Streptomyces albospinus]|uniref:hypothetical protein n=1 Tax=Streptomyces albospinus TaxID=285515 RepID=UPI00166FA2D0|nr:hypothetical protein [Streptomyces albospinus]